MPTNAHPHASISGVGLALKRPLIAPLLAANGDPSLAKLSFLEIAPENWLGVGGLPAKQLASLSERYPLVGHGLCLSLGGLTPLNTDFLRQVKAFLLQHRIGLYTEHLSYSSDGYQAGQGYLYDLLPLPFTEQAVRHLAQRIRQTQDILGQRIAVENVSYYVQAPISDMDELSFIKAVLDEADCLLHLDLNNLYVNSVNFGFDASAFLADLPTERIVYAHMAGHYQQAPDLLIDTHGSAVIDPVWALLAAAYQRFGTVPTCLERDTNIPPLAVVMQEIDKIADMQRQAIKAA